MAVGMATHAQFAGHNVSRRTPPSADSAPSRARRSSRSLAAERASRGRVQSVNVPPASSMIGSSAAASHGDMMRRPSPRRARSPPADSRSSRPRCGDPRRPRRRSQRARARSGCVAKALVGGRAPSPAASAATAETRQRLAVPPAPRARRGGHELVDRGKVRRAGEHLLPLGHRDQRAPERHAAHEGLRAVDRIDDPPAPGARARLAELLAEDAVLGKARLDPRARAPLRRTVGDRHRRAVRLRLHREPRAIVPQRRRRRRAAPPRRRRAAWSRALGYVSARTGRSGGPTASQCVGLAHALASAGLRTPRMSRTQHPRRA